MREVILGEDCILQMELSTDRIENTPGTVWTTVDVRTVSLRVNPELIPAALRDTNGWTGTLSGGVTAGVSFSTFWEDENAIYDDIILASLTMTPRAFRILDGVPEATAGRCGSTGATTGLTADWYVSDIAQNQPFGGNVTFDVGLSIAIDTALLPSWG